MSTVERILSREHWLPLAFLAVLSYATIVSGFSRPQALFWDENYHIASAQKYLNGVFFMEPHPPLGKLLIAAGEGLLQRNDRNDQFIDTDYATNPPEGFDFTGYRLFPVLFAWLTAGVLYAIFFALCKNATWSLLLSLPYSLDNALIVHSRSAMLDSILLFFAMATMLAFFILVRPRPNANVIHASLLFGFAFGCALTTKAFALVFVLLVPLILWTMRSDHQKILRFAAASGGAFLLAFVGVWYAHFALIGGVEPRLPDDGYYQSSESARAYIDAGATASPAAFPVLLGDAMRFVSHYQAGVPKLDLAKDDENGSPWFLWPIGARTINYRWETPDGYSYRYLYLVPNPATWLIALASVLIGTVLFLAPYIAPDAGKSRWHFELGTLLMLYVCYMAAVSRIDRVMYLYHYFLPLLFSFIILGIVLLSINKIGRWSLSEPHRSMALLGVVVLAFLGFQTYRQFTYYEPLTDDQVTGRAIFKLWDLHCVECEAPHPLAVPAKS